MRHRIAGRHLSRTSAHRKALRRNMAQSLFQYGQIETTVVKAKELRPFVERLITLARKDDLRSRQRIISILGDRAVIARDEQEQYDTMSDARRHKVLYGRSGRRHRSGNVPASYNKKKIPFVAHSVVHKLITEVAPKYHDRPGGYTRIIRLAKRRIGDGSELALLQLVGEEGAPAAPGKKTVGLRRQKTLDRIRFLEGKGARSKSGKGKGRRQAAKSPSSLATTASSSTEEEAVSKADQTPDAEESGSVENTESGQKDDGQQ